MPKTPVNNNRVIAESSSEYVLARERLTQTGLVEPVRTSTDSLPLYCLSDAGQHAAAMGMTEPEFADARLVPPADQHPPTERAKTESVSYFA
ncbi:MAG: hypothetical protein H7279_02725 [Microbacteriaceae bacterium]|nr:hypothetical protein [Microbacteriaceae bacterium]